MLKTGIAAAVLLLISGCTTLMGPPEAPPAPSNAELEENARLKAEADALRQALDQKKAELETLKAATQQ
ncbi:hypothetical protein [Mariprofundus erugo]|nr:hypothetical protein [Mariprofundus erugo]